MTAKYLSEMETRYSRYHTVIGDSEPGKYILELVRNNCAYRLKTYLKKFPADEVSYIINCRVSGTTPLLLACRHGNLEIVQFLVNSCSADVELTGQVVFDGETIESAPPLWCSAAAGHYEVVKFLVYSGACVNSTTYTRSTPLRAACFDGHYSIVKFLIEHGADTEIANRHGHTCLMIACYKGHYKIAKHLISLNVDINRKSIKGNTALHDCAESGNLEIMKLLLENGAVMDVDSYGMTPLLAASVTGHTRVVDYIINVYREVERSEIIDALELLGATYVDKKRDMHAALDLWKKAMHMRYDSDPPISKKLSNVKNPAYECAEEVNSIEELQQLITDPDKMRIQALLTRERILGPLHPDTSYYIRFRGAIYADAGRFNRCIALWNYALDMQQMSLEPLNPMTISSFFSFTELFSLMLGDELQSDSSNNRIRKMPGINFEDVMVIMKKGVREVKSGLSVHSAIGYEEINMQKLMIVILHLCCVLAKIIKYANPEQSHEAYSLVYRLLSLNVKMSDGRTLVHLACHNTNALVTRYPLCQLPNVKLIKLLCRAGGKVDEQDDKGNTPLQWLGMCTSSLVPKMTKILLNYGAHLDVTNNSGVTFATLMKGKLHTVVNEVNHVSLACLAARVIKKCNIPYEGKIPASLYSFVSLH